MRLLKIVLVRSELITRKELSEIEKNNLILESEVIKIKQTFYLLGYCQRLVLVFYYSFLSEKD